MRMYSNIEQWDNADILQWLALNKLEDFRKSFYNNGYNGTHLFKIDTKSFIVRAIRCYHHVNSVMLMPSTESHQRHAGASAGAGRAYRTPQAQAPDHHQGRIRAAIQAADPGSRRRWFVSILTHPNETLID